MIYKLMLSVSMHIISLLVQHGHLDVVFTKLLYKHVVDRPKFKDRSFISLVYMFMLLIV